MTCARVSVFADVSRAVLWSVIVPVPATSGGVVLNEIRYDPPGADSGGEYVELMNVSAEAVELDPSWRLERGDGARAGAWDGFWVGEGFVLGSGEWVAIGDDPRAALSAVPGLQNGPDACRLVHGGDVVDRVGWGDHVHGEYVETTPAPDPVAGTIARRPDGRDTDVNGADWVAAGRETPGEANFPLRLLEIQTEFPPTDPPVPDPGRSFTLRFVARSAGLEALEIGTFALSVAGAGERWIPIAPLASGAARAESLVIGGRPRGALDLVLVPSGVPLQGDTLVVPIHVGGGPVVFSEIQPRAGEMEPEWIEIVAAHGAHSLEFWRVVDAAGSAVDLGAHLVSASAPLVFSSAADRLLGVYPHLDPARVRAAPLPVLNDRDERLVLAGAGGRVSDAVSFDAPPAGTSLERVSATLPSHDSAAWVVSPFGPTPGHPNGARAEVPEHPSLTIEPRVVTDRGAEIGFHLGEERGHLVLIVADCAGRERGRILEREGAARGGVRWDGRLDGRALAPGLYVLLARFTAGEVRVERREAFGMGWGSR